MSVLYRNPNGWTDPDEIWHGGGPRGGEGSWGGFGQVPPPPGYGVRKGGAGASGASTVRFGENFMKQKLQGTPDLVGADPEGPGPPVLLEPWSLTMKGRS